LLNNNYKTMLSESFLIVISYMREGWKRQPAAGPSVKNSPVDCFSEEPGGAWAECEDYSGQPGRRRAILFFNYFHCLLQII
jgi:hypothetical protein